MEGSPGPSFLPRIESVFYAVFDEHQGPKIVHQVPEGLIAGQHSGFSTVVSAVGSLFTTSPTSTTPGPYASEQSMSRAAASVLSSPALSRLEGRPLFPSPQKRGMSSSRFLFNFDDVSKYIIPPSALCGRLVKFATRNHRIIGFPVELKGRYRRNYFRYNLCFVFDKSADLSCYEPIVRKVSRVLTSCEVSFP
jgi:nitrogen permease regulator 2-like protein